MPNCVRCDSNGKSGLAESDAKPGQDVPECAESIQKKRTPACLRRCAPPLLCHGHSPGAFELNLVLCFPEKRPMLDLASQWARAREGQSINVNIIEFLNIVRQAIFQHYSTTPEKPFPSLSTHKQDTFSF